MPDFPASCNLLSMEAIALHINDEQHSLNNQLCAIMMEDFFFFQIKVFRTIMLRWSTSQLAVIHDLVQIKSCRLKFSRGPNPFLRRPPRTK